MNTLLYHSKEYSVNLEDTVISLYFEDASDDDRKPEPTIQDLHDHCYAELFLCLKGQMSIQTENGVIRLTDNMIVVIPPLFRHCLIPSDAGVMSCVCGFSAKRNKSAGTPSDLYKALYEVFLSAVTPITLTNAAFVRNLYALLHENPHKRFFGVHLVDSLITALELCHRADSCGEIDSQASPHYSVLTTLNSIICNEFRENLRVADIAARLYISERQVNRITRERYGMSIHQLILEKRVSMAERLIRETSLPVGKIGKQVGFQSKTCFFRAFSDKTGMTPMAYREWKAEQALSDAPSARTENNQK